MSATITVIGNLTADPELKQTNSGKSVVNFSLAWTPRKPDGSDGQTSFYNIVAWEYLADNFASSFKKGDRLMVVGRVSQDRWEDKDSGKTMTRLAITADEIGGTCRFHTVEMTKVSFAKNDSSNNDAVVEEDAESEDIFS
jgi:single-strand DNA-binding protein